jgi:hypothetical protein
MAAAMGGAQLLEQVESIWGKTIKQYENDSSARILLRHSVSSCTPPALTEKFLYSAPALAIQTKARACNGLGAAGVVFGDVVLSSWKDLVGQVTKMRTVEGYDPDQDEDGTHPHLDTHFGTSLPCPLQRTLTNACAFGNLQQSRSF